MNNIDDSERLERVEFMLKMYIKMYGLPAKGNITNSPYLTEEERIKITNIVYTDE